MEARAIFLRWEQYTFASVATCSLLLARCSGAFSGMSCTSVVSADMDVTQDLQGLPGPLK